MFPGASVVSVLLYFYCVYQQLNSGTIVIDIEIMQLATK